MDATKQGNLVARLRQLTNRQPIDSSSDKLTAAPSTDKPRTQGSAALARQRLATRPMYLGIDVQVRRPCAWCLLDEDGVMATSGWWEQDQAAEQLRRQLEVLNNQGFKVSVGIDAPRQPLAQKRPWYWRGGRWEPRKDEDKGFGRHCEMVVKSLGIANPQWTPVVGAIPPWMKLGFALFDAAHGLGQVHEVFPSAAYRMLEGCNQPTAMLNFSAFGRHPKDMLDACMAAVTVREFAQGRGGETPAGDGMGTIVLPRPLPSTDSGVMHWPQD